MLSVVVLNVVMLSVVAPSLASLFNRRFQCHICKQTIQQLDEVLFHIATEHFKAGISLYKLSPLSLWTYSPDMLEFLYPANL
jgi:hypothetical protein